MLKKSVKHRVNGRRKQANVPPSLGSRLLATKLKAGEPQGLQALSEALLLAVKKFPTKTQKISGYGLGVKGQAYIQATFDIAKKDAQYLPLDTPTKILDDLPLEVKELLQVREILDGVRDRITNQLQAYAAQERDISTKIYTLIKTAAKMGVLGAKELYQYLLENFHTKKAGQNTAPQKVWTGYEDAQGNKIVKQEKKAKGKRTAIEQNPLAVIPAKAASKA